MGVKRTRNEQDFLEERIHFVWTTTPSFLLLLLLLLFIYFFHSFINVI
ncbi:hypothetical protein NC651_029173 [Populus alba x Populus x berolinensis]|nr:hypothetical protein NC651_029173 [Populus alba x Populus x berolinensis]